MKTTQTFSILIWANKAKSTYKGIPINARVTIDGLRAEISIKGGEFNLQITNIMIY